ncbi:MAG: exosome complex RNA-binding protein Rrp4 [Candidatus Thermoplasmatota archaeon]
MSSEEIDREILLPGDEVEEDDLNAGRGMFKDNEKIYASRLGVKRIRSGYVNVAAQSGRYEPQEGEKVIGTVTDINSSFWMVDVNAPNLAVLHVNDVPWMVDYGDTASYIEVGDALLIKITSVDEQNKMQITMDEEGLKKLSDGQIIEIPPSQVPRVIGRGGSMISMLKKYTDCKIFVGQNGRIWIDGDLEGQYLAAKAIKMIEENAQAVGLTDLIKEFLEKNTDVV